MAFWTELTIKYLLWTNLKKKKKKTHQNTIFLNKTFFFFSKVHLIITLNNIIKSYFYVYF